MKTTLTIVAWISSHSNVQITHDTEGNAFDTACKLFDAIDDGTFVDPDDVIDRIADVIDEFSAHPYEWFSDTVEYEYREMSGEEYTDSLLIEIA